MDHFSPLNLLPPGVRTHIQGSVIFRRLISILYQMSSMQFYKQVKYRFYEKDYCDDGTIA